MQHSGMGRFSHCASSCTGRLGSIPEEGWQHETSLVLEQRFVETVVVPSASPTRQAVLHSLRGPLSGLPFTTLPITSPSTALTFLSHCPPRFGHHRASCSRAGVLGRRGFALESAVARVCLEAGAGGDVPSVLDVLSDFCRAPIDE